MADLVTLPFKFLKGVTKFCIAYHDAGGEFRALFEMIKQAAAVASDLQTFRYEYRDLCSPERLSRILEAERDLWMQMILIDNAIVSKLPAEKGEGRSGNWVSENLWHKPRQRVPWVLLRAKQAGQMELAFRSNVAMARATYEAAATLLDVLKKPGNPHWQGVTTGA